VIKEVFVLEKAMSRSAVYLGLAGVVSVVFGVVTLFWPGITLVALTALFGAFTLVYGAFALGSGLNLLAHRSTEWVPYILGGLAGVVIGAVTFFSPSLTDLTLLYFIAAWAIVVGVFEIIASIDVRDMVKGAGWLAASGGLSIAFGVIVAIRPGSGALAILWLIGGYAIVAGAIRMFAAYRIRAVEKDVKRVAATAQTQS
jgi:uncharacterized membrane protein HdeD (DUF308 family)